MTFVGVKDNGKPLNICSDIPDGNELDSIDFTPEKLLKVTSNVKQNSAPRLFHQHSCLAIFTSFMSVGQLPQALLCQCLKAVLHQTVRIIDPFR